MLKDYLRDLIEEYRKRTLTKVGLEYTELSKEEEGEREDLLDIYIVIIGKSLFGIK